LILQYRQYNLPFHHTFTISKGSKTHQSTLIVALQLGQHTGLGEATAISYYNVTVEQMIEDLESKRRMVEKFAFTDPERYWHYLHHLYPDKPFLVCALDMAGWDLFGKLMNKPLYEIWGTDYANATPTDYTIGLDTVEKMIEKIKEKPWPVYKIKLGTDNDIDIIEALRKHTNAPFRIDANAAWTLDEALEKLPALHKLGVEMVEQPLHKDDWDGMKELYAKSPLPLFADESCVAEKDVEKCVGHFHGINIKLTKCSGITPARRMIKKGRELNLKVMMGSMNESTIGAAAVVQLLPQLDMVDVDGPLLLAEDTATGLDYDFGTVRPSNRPGLGITMI
jgi:L-Ala-D/L-Glu epimerase